MKGLTVSYVINCGLPLFKCSSRTTKASSDSTYKACYSNSAPAFFLIVYLIQKQSYWTLRRNELNLSRILVNLTK